MVKVEFEVLRVFVGDDGEGGNLLGVFEPGDQVPEGERQAVAADLGFSETVFVEDPAHGRVRIFTPGQELPFAGHPLVGTAWLLHERGHGADVLRPPAGEVPTWREGELTWIRGRPEWAPDFELRQLASAAEVDAFADAGPDALLQVWAWEDEDRGRVRVRVFPRSLGIEEDEATGAAAVRLGAALRRPLQIRQGRGSRLDVRPGPEGAVEVGGRVEPVERRAYARGVRRANLFAAQPEYDPADPEGYRSGVTRLGRLVGAAALGASLYELPPSQSICPYHYEYGNEEWLIVLEGAPTLRHPGGESALAAGDVVCFPAGPGGAHAVTNRTSAIVRVLMVSTDNEPAVAVYPDSDKLGVWPGGDGRDDLLTRRDRAVDYWEGEVP